MRSDLFKGVVLGAITAILVLTTTTAFAGNGVGGIFNLGRNNTVNRTTTLTGSSLQINATNGGSALGLGVMPTKPPFVTNSTVKVPNLNADSLDGIDSSGFVQGGGTIVQNRLTEPIAAVHNRRTNPIAADDTDVVVVPGFGTLQASTGQLNGQPSYQLVWTNDQPTTMDIWYNSSIAPDLTTYTTVAPNTQVVISPYGAHYDEFYTLLAGYADHTATVITAAHVSASGGVFRAQAIEQ